LCTVLEEGHTSENPILKNDHIQSDGDARLDKKESDFLSLTWWVAHREGGSCKDGIEREA